MFVLTDTSNIFEIVFDEHGRKTKGDFVKELKCRFNEIQTVTNTDKKFVVGYNTFIFCGKEEFEYIKQNINKIVIEFEERLFYISKYILMKDIFGISQQIKLILKEDFDL
jgi:hypothetical protein